MHHTCLIGHWHFSKRPYMPAPALLIAHHNDLEMWSAIACVSSFWINQLQETVFSSGKMFNCLFSFPYCGPPAIIDSLPAPGVLQSPSYTRRWPGYEYFFISYLITILSFRLFNIILTEKVTVIMTSNLSIVYLRPWHKWQFACAFVPNDLSLESTAYIKWKLKL